MQYELKEHSVKPHVNPNADTDCKFLSNTWLLSLFCLFQDFRSLSMLFLLSFRPAKYKMNNVAVDGNTCYSVSNQKLDEKKIHLSIDPRLENRMESERETNRLVGEVDSDSLTVFRDLKM